MFKTSGFAFKHPVGCKCLTTLLTFTETRLKEYVGKTKGCRNGILLAKNLRPTVRDNCSSDWE